MTVRDGTTFTFHTALVRDGGRLAGETAIFVGDLVDVQATGGNGAEPGFRFNPTTNDTRSIKITAKTSWFLGGSLPASASGVGSGYYATAHADAAELGGELEIGLLYGFVPTAGQQFMIVESRDSRTGTFSGLPEGSVAADFGSVVLRVSHAGGDGNDVVLTAEPGSVRVEPSSWSETKRILGSGNE